MDFNQSINHFTKVTNGISLLYFKGKLYVLFPYVTYEGKNFLNQPFLNLAEMCSPTLWILLNFI